MSDRRWTLTGDLLFTMHEDGGLSVDGSSGARAAIGLGEAAALHVARASWLAGAGRGIADDTLTARLDAWGFEDEGRSVAARLVEHGLVRDADAPLDRAARSRAPVIMVFCPRSGSNMLRWLLEAHPRFACPPPSPFLHLLLEAADHVWSAAAYRSLRSPKAWTRAMLRRWVEAQLLEVTRRQGKERWCFRHWVSYRKLHAIDELFGGTALYLFLVRHALDVVDAACKVYVPAETWQAGPNSLDRDVFKTYGGSHHLAYAHFWREVSERMFEFRAAHPGRVHVVRYEDLVTDSAAELGGMFEFLGEADVPDLSTKAFARPPRMLPAWHGHEVTRTQRIEQDRVGLWKAWRPDLIRAVAPAVNDMLETWGYERATA